MSQSRRLLLVANSGWNLTHFRAGLIRGLQTAGYELHAAVPAGESDVGLSIPKHSFPLEAQGTAPLREMATLLALVRIVRGVRPAAVLSFTPKGNIYGGLAARANRVPLLPNVSGLGTGFIAGGRLQQIQSMLYREAFRSVPTVFFQNEEDAAHFHGAGLVRPEQVRLLPGSGVDLDHFAPVPLPRRAQGVAHLLFIGRLLGDKGVRELADAMRRLKPRFPELRLTLVGEIGAANRTAITAEEVKAWESEGLLVHAGHAPDVRSFIADADGVVLPSYREGMPRALLEAGAMGRPLLASNVPGCRHLVADGINGLLFEARSVESLAAAIERFLAAPMDERRAWGEAARQKVEREFDEQLVVQAYRNALVSLTSSDR